MNNIHLK